MRRIANILLALGLAVGVVDAAAIFFHVGLAGLLPTRNSNRMRITLYALLATILAGCVFNSQPSAAHAAAQMAEQTVASAECYSLGYSDAVGSASERLFPTWFMLLPGADAGAAVGRRNPLMNERDWENLSRNSGWGSLAPDSLDVRFTGNFEGVRIRVARSGTNLIGRATWLTDVVGPRETSMRVVGTREQCPEKAPS